MKAIILTGLIALFAFSCANVESQDPCSEFDVVDLEMLNLIEEIKTKHADNQKFLSNFNMEQVYWIQYRDHHLKSLYPKDWKRHYRKEYGKEVFNPCKCKEMTRYTKDRIEELNRWLEGGPSDQDDCPSLWNQ